MNLKDQYINFFKEKGHAMIPSAPVIPENDPTVLFNTAGMQPLVPYLKGEDHPLGKRLCDVQKCVRTNDLEEIGDTTHHTFFEMLGNWSLGDYFKKESIAWSYELLTKRLQIPVDRLAVTVFAGNDIVPRDTESAEIWMSLGIPVERIRYLGVEDNWWGPAGETGPCGPDTEIFYWRDDSTPPTEYDPTDERWVEIWNNVFMQYEKHADGSFTPLTKKNVDTGMGVERVTAVLEGVRDNYRSSLFQPLITKIEVLSGKNYQGHEKAMRIIADHMRAIVMIAGEDTRIFPSNKDQGYILRRLIRRVIRYAKGLDIDLNSHFMEALANIVITDYRRYYPELERNQDHILTILANEQKKFSRTIEKGLREFDKMIGQLQDHNIPDQFAFKLYDTYGFPIELTMELAQEQGYHVDQQGFEALFKAHQEKSRAGSSQKFKGGLAGDGAMETKYHTATHLLNAALKVVLGADVHQKGSNITAERMRFDFSCDHKLTSEEKAAVENLVNDWITAGLEVRTETMSKAEALQIGAEAMFIEKYPDIVTVYFIGDISKELCGGPHVKNTRELGRFMIKKEEASSAGVRRIKAILESE